MLLKFPVVSGVAFLSLSLLSNTVSAGIVKDLSEGHICQKTISKLDDFIGDGYGARVLKATNNPDSQPITYFIEQNFSDGDVHYNLTVTPTSDGYCTFEYTRTWVENNSCMASTSKGMLKDFKYVDSINKNFSYFKSEKNFNIYATEIKGGQCLIVKKEVGYREDKF